MSLRVFDKYEVIRRLASGGMGDIFLARQLGAAGFSRLVVLKSLRADIVERDEFFVQFNAPVPALIPPSSPPVSSPVLPVGR